ncbi:MAG: type I methionyl aminopeptidase [Candidatus Omnitrophica bacterium]|nr:type I methionyl aminopeptidase [Candidatus Omnitrophota bacterium]
MIFIKNKEEIMIMRRAGRMLAEIVQFLKSKIKPNISTYQIDEYACQLMKDYGVIPAFKGYRGFPAHICTSVNAEVVHGIPNKELILKEGDLISIDIGIEYKGFYVDSAFTLSVGKIDRNKQRLIETTKEALYEGIKKAKAGNLLSDISFAIQSYVESRGFSVVRDFTGHGIGKAIHEEPPVPNFGRPHRGPLLKEGMVLAIEPMVNMGGWEVEIMDNGWTAITKDRLPSAHFEHTVAITDKEAEILTK